MTAVIYRTRTIIRRGLYIFSTFSTAVYIVELLVLQTIYVLNKVILQFLSLKSAVYNQERFLIKSRLVTRCVYCTQLSLIPPHNTLEELLLFNRNKFFWGEHKVITPKQQPLGIILCIFMYLKWPWLLRFFAKML